MGATYLDFNNIPKGTRIHSEFCNMTNTFDTGIVSDASLLPGAVGKFDLYVPQDFGAFIGYSYVIDWEEYQ